MDACSTEAALLNARDTNRLNDFRRRRHAGSHALACLRKVRVFTLAAHGKLMVFLS
jgi:hypothetical protein